MGLTVPTFAEIARRVLAFIEACAGPEPPTERAFDSLAREVFAFQIGALPAYRAFCLRRGRTPATVRHWSEIPALPTAAFKSMELACAPARRVFLTSGTTAGPGARGRHLVPDPELYRRSAVAHFRAMVLPDGLRPRFLALLASPRTLPHSSLAQMVDWVAAELGEGTPLYLVDERGFDPARAADAIERQAAGGGPLCLIGWRVTFTALLEHCLRSGRRLALPADSRIVDTGGSKGGRALSDAGFRSACWSVLHVPGYQCVNEYGMTELCSQLYDDVLRARHEGSERRRSKRGPAWMRTRAVDPATLEPVGEGQRGILAHLDLANAGSVIAVQTEDVGRVVEGGVQLEGRIAGAEPRGCALALAEIEAARA